MVDSDDTAKQVDWGIEIDDMGYPETSALPEGTLCVKAIDVIDVPTPFARAAVVKLVELPKTFKILPDMSFAEIIECPEVMNLQRNTALGKVAHRPDLPDAPPGYAMIDTYPSSAGTLPRDPDQTGIRVPLPPAERGIRVPLPPKGVDPGRAKVGIRVPILPRGFRR